MPTQGYIYFPKI